MCWVTAVRLGRLTPSVQLPSARLLRCGPANQRLWLCVVLRLRRHLPTQQ